MAAKKKATTRKKANVNPVDEALASHELAPRALSLALVRATSFLSRESQVGQLDLLSF